ncbi:MAG TPA: sugar phosphate nucleotidyltransferase, partial [Candidatus Saccharimonadales bacterium]|nr:sugar phosphate nucleotidyltransferase [Candidatus Saccharimonadales bacterium]
MKVVLLAAGFGSRLWPLSTSGKPKQFQTLLGEQSLLQHTYKLFSEIASPLDIYVLTLQGLEHWVYQQIPGMDPNKILLVPERRNTFPHTLFALRSITASPDEPVLFTGTDIYMSDAKDFIKTVKTAMRKRGKQRTSKDTILFCSSAERPDTNAGYITLHKDRVTKHLEKPDLETIQKLSREAPLYKTMFTYITSQHSLKQSLASADRHIAALAKELLDAEAPDIAAALLAMPLCDISNTVFANARNLTAAVTSCDFMDMGSFMALYR